MSLILEGAALAIEGAALIIDCACCIKELCDKRACLAESDCDEAALQPGAECFCRGNQCTSDPSCVDDLDCPEGYVCVDGRCVPPCRGQECTEDADCPEECICVDGGCFDPSSIYYCWKQVKDEQGNDIPDADQEIECNKGKPTPPMYTSAGGPYLSYALCAATGCGAKFECNPVIGDCYPDPSGMYEEFSECQAACGDGSDLGRCCKSEVCYDADGNVTDVTSTCDDCCGGTPVPIDPDVPGLGERCDNTTPCAKTQCISDGPITFPGCRTFRQFNTLYRDCDLCPTDAVGPCCHEDTNPDSATFGQDICTLQDEKYCTEILDGDFKGSTWWTCTDSRTDLGRDFACPNCNGSGDCACEADQFCFSNRCNDCENPNANPTQEGKITAVRFDRKAGIDGDPRLYRVYYFRVLTCPGQSPVDFKREPVAIYGRNVLTPAEDSLLLIVDNDPDRVDSRGYTSYTDDECYISISAQKMDGTPAEIGLCYYWQDRSMPTGDCPWDEMGYSCECLGDPAFACPNCHQNPDLESESYTWEVITPQMTPPQEGACFEVNPCATDAFKDATKAWFRETWSYVWAGDFDANTYVRVRERLIALMPDGKPQDVTDEWVTGKPVGVYSDCLVRSSSSVCEDVDEFGEPVCQECVGSDCESPLGIEPPAAPPDPLGICTLSRKLNDPNPLP